MKQIADLILPYRIVRAFAVAALIVFIGLMISINVAVASGSHDHNIDLTINYEYEQPVDPLAMGGAQDSGVSDSELDKTRAMSAAGDTCVFDYAPGWQGCVGGGWAGSESAVNGSIVTRVDDFMIRTNYQADTDFDDYAISVGGSWHF